MTAGYGVRMGMESTRMAERGVTASTVLLACLFAMQHEAAAQQEAADTLSASVQVGYSDDDNLFRLPDDVDPPDGQQRDDALMQLIGNVRIDKTLGLQRLRAEVLAARNEYRENDYLNFTTVNGSGSWQWAFGNHWWGVIAASQSEASRSFADSRTFEQSINTFHRYSADANYAFHPAWSIGAAAVMITSRYSDDASTASEYDEEIIEAKLTYRTPTLSQLALVVSHLDGTYPNQTDVTTRDTDYEQQDIQLRGDWRLSALSRIFGYIGVADREYPNLSARNYSGVVGRLAYDWKVTETVGLNLMVRRELGAEGDLVDNFVLTEAVVVTPTWSLTPALTLGARFERRERSFGGDPGFGVIADVSKDDVTDIIGGGLTYVPRKFLSLQLTYQYEQRESDISLREYDVDIWRTSVQYLW